MKTREELIARLKEDAWSPARAWARLDALLEEREWVVEATNGGSPHTEPYIDEVEYFNSKTGERSWEPVLRFEPNEKSYEDYEEVSLQESDFEWFDDLDNCIKALDEGVMVIGGQTLKLASK